MSGAADGKDVIRVLDHSGTFIKDITSGHFRHVPVRLLQKHPTVPSCILEACYCCEAIWMYNVDSTEGKEIYTGCKPYAMCEGPDNSVLVWDEDGKVLQLKWDNDEERLKLIKQRDTHKNYSRYCSMCFDMKTNCIVLCDGILRGVRLRDGSAELLWKRYDTARAVTCDSHGHVYRRFAVNY